MRIVTATPPCRPGDIAVDWDNRVILIRSHQRDYWLDSRYPAVGRALMHDDAVTAPQYELIRTGP